MVSRFQGSGRTKEGGYLATHKQDFNAHATGGDFRHGADDIDMNPALSLYPAGTVQGTLELIAGAAASSGSGFVSIGNVGADGYAIGSYNVGLPATPTFRAALLASFTDARLQNGGIVFVLPGTYKLNTTVDVPAGITIMGEVSSSIVIGEMSEEPMFRFLRATDFPTVGGDSGSGDIPADVGSPIDQSGLLNIILADNLDGYVGSGGQPNSTMQTVPMVEMEASSRVNIENVKFLGRVNYGPVPDRGKTLRAIGTTGGGTTATHLTVRRCFFDGMANGIDFSPGHGDIDHLTIDLCRARIFGSEASVPTSIAEGSFSTMSLCNLVATNNYVFGYGTFPTQFVAACFTVTSVGSGGTDVSILVTGTTGSPSESTSGPLNGLRSVFFNESSATSMKAVVTNNNWSADVDSKWFITVGGGGNAVDDGAGDFIGPGAIDLLLSLGGGHEYPVTVIVNEGTYEVTVDYSGFSDRYNFIGNDESGGRPIFDMNQGAGVGTDPLGNRRFVVGGRIENIHFRSNTATTGTTSFHSIRPTSNDAVFVKNCLFSNCTLSIDDLTPRIEIIDCEFRQDDTLPDNLGLLAPRRDYILVEGCSFTGNGYAGFIGYDSGLAYGGSPNLVGRVVVRNCVMNIDAPTFGIDDASPLTTKAYFAIDTSGVAADSHMVEMSGCQIMTNDNLSQQSSVIGGVISGMTSWVFVRASTIKVDDCIITSPMQTKSFGVPFPGALFAPNRGAIITNSKFFDGGVPCQISGMNGRFGVNNYDDVIVDNCYFKTTSDVLTLTLLDIDLRVSLGVGWPPGAKVIVSNSTFRHTDSTDDLAVQQFDVTGVSYFAHGVVQIYAFMIPVDFHNNHIESFIPSSVPVVSGTSNSSGLLIHNNISTVGTKSEGIIPINVHDNEIFIHNDNEAFYAGDFIASLSLYGIVLDVHDNQVRFRNDNWPSTGWVGCAHFDTQTTQTGGIGPDSMVHHNTFARKGSTGALTNIDNYVLISGSSKPGRLTENIFDSEYVNGSVIGAVSDLSSSWYVYQNKNQTDSFLARPGNGTLALGVAGSWLWVFPQPNASIPLINDSFVGITTAVIGGPAVTALRASTDNGVTLQYAWQIPLTGYIPYGAKITNITAFISLGATPAVTSTGVVHLTNSAGTENTTVPGIAAPGPVAVSLTPVGTYTSIPGEDAVAEILYAVQDPAAVNVSIDIDVSISYRW